MSIPTISRTAYNALVDDDGSGLTGSVWDKNDVKDILDAIDSMMSGFYAEGTFTPTIAFGGASTGITYSTQLGTYTKVGNYVFVEVRVALSSKGSATGAAQINGLPFSGSGVATSQVGDAFNMSGLTGALYGTINVTGVALCQTSATGRANLTDAAFTNTSDVRIALAYHV